MIIDGQSEVESGSDSMIETTIDGNTLTMNSTESSTMTDQASGAIIEQVVVAEVIFNRVN